MREYTKRELKFQSFFANEISIRNSYVVLILTKSLRKTIFCGLRKYRAGVQTVAQ